MASSPEEMIQNFLSDPDALSKIGDMLGALTGGGSEGEEPKPPPSSSSPFDNPEMLLKLGQILGSFSDGDDNETRLIQALKPYLSEKRAESADKAIKLMKISKMSSLFGDLNLF